MRKDLVDKDKSTTFVGFGMPSMKMTVNMKVKTVAAGVQQVCRGLVRSLDISFSQYRRYLRTGMTSYISSNVLFECWSNESVWPHGATVGPLSEVEPTLS